MWTVWISAIPVAWGLLKEYEVYEDTQQTAALDACLEDTERARQTA